MRIRREEFEEWKNSLVTQEVFKFMDYEGNLERGFVANGSCRGNSAQETGEAYLIALQRAMVKESFKDIDFEDIEGMYHAEDEILIEDMEEDPDGDSLSPDGG